MPKMKSLPALSQITNTECDENACRRLRLQMKIEPLTWVQQSKQRACAAASATLFSAILVLLSLISIMLLGTTVAPEKLISSLTHNYTNLQVMASFLVVSWQGHTQSFVNPSLPPKSTFPTLQTSLSSSASSPKSPKLPCPPSASFRSLAWPANLMATRLK